MRDGRIFVVEDLGVKRAEKQLLSGRDLQRKKSPHPSLLPEGEGVREE